MRLEEFSVRNFRSITYANKIKFHDLTVLIGKNNEGKSNLLSALNIAMNAVIHNSDDSYYKRVYRSERIPENIYNWRNDFPLQFQNRKQSLTSVFRLTFSLDNDEIKELRNITKIQGCNGIIPIEVSIGKENLPKVIVPKQRTTSYNEKSAQITDYISDKLRINYIQAVRTEDMAIEALQRAVNYRLYSLESNELYREATNTINKLYDELFNELSDQLIDPLKAFLPNIKDIKINLINSNRRVFRRDFDIIIDDGISTSIRNKGDGIKSLVTLAILKERSIQKGASVIAIEEPESHLHPGAIHNLVDVINNLSENNQVIISTHNPLFVRLSSIESNIIIDQGKAKSAKNINEIRDILGIQPGDNLNDTRYALIVEGETDKISLLRILSFYSETIKKSISNNELVIYPINGASSLSYHLTFLKNMMCKCIVLMDHDYAGNEAIKIAKIKNGLTEKDYRQTICKGQSESEFEDCISSNLYKEIVKDKYKVNLDVKEFRNNHKWSDRLKTTFASQGIEWNEDIEKEIKILVANLVKNSKEIDESVIIQEKAGFINSLIELTEEMINN